jgi:hypothetical protein
MPWPIGTKFVIPLEVLARDLQGHRFVVKMPGKHPGEYYEQLVEVTGDYDSLRMEYGLEVKAVDPA